MPWRRPDERARRTRAHAAALSSGRSTPAWCAERGSSSPCRCFSRRSPSAGPSRCRRRRCRPRSTDRPPNSSHGSSLGTTRIDLPDLPEPRRRRVGLGTAGSLPLPSADGPLPSKHPRPGARRTPEHRRGRAGRLAARNRDRRTPRQQRRRARRQRQRFGHGRAARARACVRARVRLGCATAPVPHARLRLHRRRRVRCPRRGSVRGAVALPRRGSGRDQPGCDRRRRPTATAHRRRHSSFTGRRTCANRGGSRARGVRSRPGAFVRPPPAARPRLSVHVRRARAVRRARHPGSDAHHRSGCSVAGLRGRPAQRRAPGRARQGDPEPRRLARRRPRACAGNDELRVPRSTIRAGLDDRARAPDGALAVCDRNDRSLRPVQAAARSLGPAVRSLRRRLLFWGYAGLLLFVAAKLGAFPKGSRDRSRSTATSTGPRRWSSGCWACCCSWVGSLPGSA